MKPGFVILRGLGLRMFEDMVLSDICGPEKEKVTGG
jgi:hypothetical protein